MAGFDLTDNDVLVTSPEGITDVNTICTKVIETSALDVTPLKKLSVGLKDVHARRVELHDLLGLPKPILEKKKRKKQHYHRQQQPSYDQSVSTYDTLSKKKNPHRSRNNHQGEKEKFVLITTNGNLVVMDLMNGKGGWCSKCKVLREKDTIDSGDCLVCYTAMVDIDSMLLSSEF